MIHGTIQEKLILNLACSLNYFDGEAGQNRASCSHKSVNGMGRKFVSDPYVKYKMQKVNRFTLMLCEPTSSACFQLSDFSPGL